MGPYVDESAPAKADGDCAPELEITPEMIQAGVDCLNRFIDHATGPGEGVQSISADWVKEAYLAMQRSRRPEALSQVVRS
jgi:hypothetical protein